MDEPQNPKRPPATLLESPGAFVRGRRLKQTRRPEGAAPQCRRVCPLKEGMGGLGLARARPGWSVRLDVGAVKIVFDLTPQILVALLLRGFVALEARSSRSR